MGLPATAPLGGVRRVDHRRARRPDHRLDAPGVAGTRDQSSADVLPAARLLRRGSLRPASGSSWCEWKGQASYYDLVTPTAVAPRAAWTYLSPTPGFTAIAGAVAVMAGLVDRCTVSGEQVVPQPGGFYGGWVTSWIAGPFKGVPGSMGW